LEEEVPITPGDYSKYDEYALYDARNYVALELKYFPRFNWLDQVYRPYISLLSKIGGRYLHVQDEYPKSNNLVYHLNSDFKDLGPCLGLHFGEQWGVDVSLGAVYRWEVKAEDIYRVDLPVLYTQDVHHNVWRMNIRANLFYNLSYKDKFNHY
jgi:hypothetical protein